MTYNLIARYIRKYGELPQGTEVPFITKRYPGSTPLVVQNFKEEVVEAFQRLYGVNLRQEIDIKGAAAVEIINPNKQQKRASQGTATQARRRSRSKSWGELSIFGKFFRLLKWIFYAFLALLAFVGIIIAYYAIKEAA